MTKVGVMDGIHPAQLNSPGVACAGHDAGLAINTRRSSHIGEQKLVAARSAVVGVSSYVRLTAVCAIQVAVPVPERHESRPGTA
jgi:hypothetical protein